jgi:hypothetical protein
MDLSVNALLCFVIAVGLKTSIIQSRKKLCNSNLLLWPIHSVLAEL